MDLSRYILGLQLFSEGRWEEARPHLKTSIELVGNQFGLHTQLRADLLDSLGRCHQQLGALDEVAGARLTDAT
jgi:hypothetical protein